MHSFKEQIFFDVECQGAYAGDGYIEFKDRIGKETELKTMQFAGELNKEAIKKIEAAKTYLDDKLSKNAYRGKQRLQNFSKERGYFSIF